MITRRAWGRVGVGVASALAMVATPLAAQAKPVPTVGCGTVLTSSVVLTRDLVDCSGDGLVVGADGITVDLGGHTVSGDGVPGTMSVDAGVRVEGRHRVTVVDGGVSGFDRGVALIDSDRIRVAAITASATTRSVIYLTNTTGSVITANAVTTPNGGIYLTGGSAHNTISHNRAFGSEQGITIDGADDNTVAFNLIDHNSDNMIVVGNRNLITGNVVSHASGCGDDGCGYGISQEGGSGNRIVGNLVSGSLFDGIRISNFFRTHLRMPTRSPATSSLARPATGSPKARRASGSPRTH